MKRKLKIPQAYHRVSIKAIQFRGKKILLVKEVTGEWNLPGGGLDHGENIRDCLRREVREEMGVGLKKISKYPIVAFPMVHQERPRIIVGYEVKFSSLNFTPSDECLELGFFGKEEIKKMKFFKDMKEGLLTLL